MTVSVYFSTGLRQEDCGGYDYAIGVEPTSLKMTVHHNLGLLGTASVPLPDEVLTFLLTSLGVWAADKVTPRQQAPDAWTRRLQSVLPGGGVDGGPAGVVLPGRFSHRR